MSWFTEHGIGHNARKQQSTEPEPWRGRRARGWLGSGFMAPSEGLRLPQRWPLICVVRVSLSTPPGCSRHPGQARHRGEGGRRRGAPDGEQRAFSPEGHSRRPQTWRARPRRTGSDAATRLHATRAQGLSRRRFRQRLAHAQCLNDGGCATTTCSQSVGRQQAAVGPERLTTTTAGLHAPSTEICYSGLITSRVLYAIPP